MFIDTANLSCFLWFPGRRRLVASLRLGSQWGVGQLADRPAVNREVGGSSPPAPVIATSQCDAVFPDRDLAVPVLLVVRERSSRRHVEDQREQAVRQLVHRRGTVEERSRVEG